MSETIRYKPCAEPGAAAVTFLAKMIEHPEPGFHLCGFRVYRPSAATVRFDYFSNAVAG